VVPMIAILPSELGFVAYVTEETHRQATQK